MLPMQAGQLDTFDLRDQLHPDGAQHLQAHADAAGMHYGAEEEEHSILEDDSEQDEGEELYEDDDMSSTLSIPNESIDFDMVYALHSFAATVEGQANVVKGDSLFLMDDSNSYWWLVRVLKTQEVGYIPAENIETPFERLARLNKHRNVDLGLATAQEQQESLIIAQQRLRHDISIRHGHDPSNPSVPDSDYRTNNRRKIHFNSVRTHYRYIPALREGEVERDDDEWETGGFLDEDAELAGDYVDSMDDDFMGVEIDDEMAWEDEVVEDIHHRPVATPGALQLGSLREQQHQQLLLAQHQQQLQQQQDILEQQHQQQQHNLLQQMQLESERQQAAQAAQQAQQEAAAKQQLDSALSREQLVQDAPNSQTQTARPIDPAEVTETKKMTATPNIAREIDDRLTGQLSLPSSIVEDERKRVREDESSDDSSRKRVKGKDKMPPPVSSVNFSKPTTTKLRKERSTSSTSNGGDTTDDEGSQRKKKISVFGALFTRKKDKKDKQTTSVGSIESVDSLIKEEPVRPRNTSSDGTVSPTTEVAQQQQQALNTKNPPSPTEQEAPPPSTPDRSSVSVHAHSLRQRDQQQQALYQQYLNRSPSSPPEAQPSYGLQSASTVMLHSPSNSALGPPQPRPRPGSLIITSSSSNDGQASLNVIRVFAGNNVQTEATFKTVLLNASTTSSELVRQALQRFRLPAGDDDSDYYLTVKQVEGGAFAVLEPHEKPLVVFETLVNETIEMPKLNRNSVGSISSIVSNLSMLPAIKKLSMNDFTDDSSVKFYLNRRTDDSDDDFNGQDDEDVTLKANMLFSSENEVTSQRGHLGVQSGPDRFTSPSIRFPLQVVIYAEDLPDGMQFHPTTEAIVYKACLPDPASPVVVSPALRRKIFMLPKNVTVAEVTEIGLERFGIQDGVVDGGDEVEDKTTKRRSGIRVRYGLRVSIDGHEKELAPSSKIIDTYPRPPQYRNMNPTGATKRRSLDPSLIFGTIEDIRSDDPIFVIRRAVSYRNSRRRSSVPLDEIALSKLHRESSSSYSSDSPISPDEGKFKQPSRQDIIAAIAAQRAVTRATQLAIISTQSNSVRGTDVLLPGNAMLRSSRYDPNEPMRYSYVEADGETYDISDIVEEEWRDTVNEKDLLEGVFRNRDGIGEKLDRFISKIRKGKQKEREYPGNPDALSPTRSVSPSEYSVDTEVPSRSVTPGSAGIVSRMNNGLERDTPAADGKVSRPGTVTPTAGLRSSPLTHTRRHPSITSVISDYSGPPVDGAKVRSPRRIFLPKDDFGLTQMISVIEFRALKPKGKERPPPHMVDELLFGIPIELDSLHPAIREIYAPAFKELEETDKMLDAYLSRSLVGAV